VRFCSSHIGCENRVGDFTCFFDYAASDKEDSCLLSSLFNLLSNTVNNLYRKAQTLRVEKRAKGVNFELEKSNWRENADFLANESEKAD
jgi:hypothetical protein